MSNLLQKSLLFGFILFVTFVYFNDASPVLSSFPDNFNTKEDISEKVFIFL